MLDLKDLLSKILNMFYNPFTTASNSLTQSTGGGQKTFNIPITIPQGYKFLTINSVKTSYAECLINAFSWDATNSRVIVSLRNTYSGTLNCKVDVEVICYKYGGGYLTSKLYEIFSHLERWWEYVRFKGFTCEDINSLVWFGYVYWLLSTRKFQCNDARWWLNKLYQIARRSLYGLLQSRCKNNTSTNKFGCSKNSDKQARVGVHQPILFYIKCRRFIQIFIRKQRRVLAKCARRLECKHRVSCWWRGANVRHRGFHIILYSKGGGYEQCWI